MATQHYAEFDLGDEVIIDRTDMKGFVIGVAFRPGLTEYQVGWYCNGDFKSLWVDAWRLSRPCPA